MRYDENGDVKLENRGQLLEIIMRHENGNLVIEGDEAEKWLSHCNNLSVMAANRAGNQNPFDHDPVKMKWIDKYIHND